MTWPTVVADLRQKAEAARTHPHGLEFERTGGSTEPEVVLRAATLIELLDTLTVQQMVVDTAAELLNDYSQAALHVERKERRRLAANVCNWCGLTWPCATRRLVDAQAALAKREAR